MPLDTTVRHAAAQKVLEDAQVYRTDAGEKQVAADRHLERVRWPEHEGQML